jgi:glycosyltransferase involved in cell wall biosynthesis
MRSHGIASGGSCERDDLALGDERSIRMKILLVNDYGMPVGGAEVLTLALRDALRRQGHDVRLFASSAGSSPDSQTAEYVCFGTLSRWRTILQAFNPWAYVRLRRVLQEFRPDVVHVRMFLTQLSPLILPLLRRVPALYHVVWYRPVCQTGTKMLPRGSPCREPAGVACYRNGCVPLRDWVPLQLQMWLWKKWRHAFSRIVANSHAVQGSLLADGVDEVEVIHNGVAIESLTRVWSLTPLAVFAGRLVPEKGVDVLVQAFALVVRKVPDARLLIAGDGPELKNLVELAERLGAAASITFLGHLPKETLETKLTRAWVQVVPSRWAEPFGLVAVEAMMRETAVIASRMGGLEEILQDGKTGYLVRPNDPYELAQRLEELLRDRSKANEMGRSGRRLAEARFSLPRQCEQFVSLYQQMVSDMPVLVPAKAGAPMQAGRR